MVFHCKLVFSAGYRALYQTNGSFGFENDYLRVARDLGTSVPVIAGGMLFVTVIVLPGIVWWTVRRARD